MKNGIQASNTHKKIPRAQSNDKTFKTNKTITTAMNILYDDALQRFFYLTIRLFQLFPAAATLFFSCSRRAYSIIVICNRKKAPDNKNTAHTNARTRTLSTSIWFVQFISFHQTIDYFDLFIYLCWQFSCDYRKKNHSGSHTVFTFTRINETKTRNENQIGFREIEC